MNRKVRFCFLMLVSVMVLTMSLSGCGGASQQASTQASQADSNAAAVTPSQINSGEKVTISHFTIGNEDKTWIKDVMPDFEKTHPNVKMEFITVPYEEFDAKLRTMIAGGTSPDVTSHYGAGGFIEYYNKNMILDLTPLMSAAKYNPVDEGVRDDLLKIYNVNGKQYGIPVSAYVSMLFYNKDMFDKAKLPYPTTDYEDKSWTFDAMVEVAKKLTTISPNLEDCQFGLKFDEWSDRDMRPIYFGAKVYSDDTWTNGGYPSECYYGSPEAIKATQRYTDLIYKDKVAPTQEDVKAMGNGAVFATGKVGMYATGAWVLASAKDCPFQIGVAAIPWGGNDKARDVLYVDPLMILKDSKHPAEALEWIGYLTSKDVQEIAIDKANNPPANKLAYDKYFSSVKGVDPAAMKAVVDGGIKYGTEAYNHLVSNSSQIIDAIINEMGPNENTGAPAEQYCKNTQEKVDKILKENKK